MKHKIEIYKSKNGYRLRIIAPNGKQILENGQGLSNKADLEEMLSNFITAVINGKTETVDKTDEKS